MSLILEVNSLFCFNFSLNLSQGFDTAGTGLDSLAIHFLALQVDVLPFGGLDI